MTTFLDERTAWDLVAAFPSAARQDGEVRRVYHDPDDRVWLQVHASGRWEASPTPDEAAKSLLDLFVPLQIRPDLVIAQIGQSLDGRIATPTGHSHYVTGRDDIVRLHRLRAVVDAVVVGASTVLADDPRLTVRKVPGPSPTRVVLDPSGRVPETARVFSDGRAPTLRIRAGRGGSAGEGELALPARPDGEIAPVDIVSALRDRGLARILVEGGAVTVSRFLDADVLDRLHVTVAPIVIGAGPVALNLRAIERMDEAMRPPHRRYELGDDVLYDLDLG